MVSSFSLFWLKLVGGFEARRLKPLLSFLVVRNSGMVGGRKGPGSI